MSRYIVFQPAGMPAAIACIPDAIEFAAGCALSVPAGLPYWEVGKAELDGVHDLYGDIRAAWELDVDALGEPSGYGEKTE